MGQVYIYSGGIITLVAGFKNFSGSLKSCQKVKRVRSENSAGLGSVGVLLRGVEKKRSVTFNFHRANTAGEEVYTFWALQGNPTASCYVFLRLVKVL